MRIFRRRDRRKIKAATPSERPDPGADVKGLERPSIPHLPEWLEERAKHRVNA